MVRLHELRHYAATRLLADGTDIRTVAGRLGQPDESTTLGLSSHVLPARNREPADHLGELVVARQG